MTRQRGRTEPYRTGLARRSRRFSCSSHDRRVESRKEERMAGGTTVQTGPATWQLDPAPSSVELSVKHMMMTTVRGRFKNVKARLTGDRDNPDGAGLEATIEAKSVDTGVADRDGHLRGPDFFDAERFPQITFRSKRFDGPAPKQEG